MARPSKSVKTISKNLTIEEKTERLETEEKLKGGVDKISPPSYLNEKQKQIFSYIVAELEVSGILGNLDIYILSTCSVAIDRLQNIESMINQDSGMMLNKDLMSAKDKYTKDLFRTTNELSLSPQSRAKMGNINLRAKENKEDAVLKILAGGKK